MGCFLPAFNPDVWPPSNPSRRGTVATGSARGLKTWLFTVRAGFGTLGCVLTAFTPDVWPPSNPPRQGTAAGLFFTGFQSGRLAALKRFPAGYGCHWLCYRGFKTWLFTVSGRLWHNGLRFNGFHSGRLAALKPFPAGYGCHWLC